MPSTASQVQTASIRYARPQANGSCSVGNISHDQNFYHPQTRLHDIIYNGVDEMENNDFNAQTRKIALQLTSTTASGQFQPTQQGLYRQEFTDFNHQETPVGDKSKHMSTGYDPRKIFNRFPTTSLAPSTLSTTENISVERSKTMDSRIMIPAAEAKDNVAGTNLPSAMRSHVRDIQETVESMSIELPASPTKLVPLEINFLSQQNRDRHQTNDYDSQLIILRRGQPFFISVRFDKPFDSQVCKLTLQFTLGTQSIISKGTHIRVPVNGTSSLVTGWTANVVSEGKNSYSQNVVELEINTSPCALIGRYKVYLETQYKQENPCLFKYAEDVPLIANPFCKGDQCYMENENEIFEYVYDEDGIIYLGTHDSTISRPWCYGQFQHPCLDIALWLLERASLPYESRGDVYHIIRAMAAMINGSDRGMIESFKPGNVGASTTNSSTVVNARQGFDPNEWMGSVKIIKKFMELRGQPVRYGNSWTYTAVLCTLARALGIPCRVVTAFNTGHDCDLNTTIDRHWDRNHRPVTQLNRDVVKPSHCWNEMWFKRYDLPSHLQGWQAVDCTSSTASECMYRLGPCSVNAIRDETCCYLSDGHMFLSNLKGYMVHWIAERNGDMIPFAIDDDYLATKIVTKAVGSDEPEDLLSKYKSNANVDIQDGVRSQLMARKKCISEYISRHSTKNDVDAEVELLQESAHGDTVVLRWTLTNKSENRRICELSMSSFFSSVDGKLLAECKEQRGDVVVLEAGKKKQHFAKIRAEDYVDKIKPYHMIRIYAMLFVKETGQTKPVHYDFSFESYKMIKIMNDISNQPQFIVNGKIPIKVQITNPLKRPLQHCTLHIEGIGTPKTIFLERALRPLEVTTYQTLLVPDKVGRRTLYIGFSSSTLNNVFATAVVNICEALDSADVDDDQSTIENKENDSDKLNGTLET